MTSPSVEWATIPDNQIVIVSCESGEFWFIDLRDCADTVPFFHPMTVNGSPCSTAGLLNGAIALGLGRHAGSLKLCTHSLPKYVLDLVASYHNARRTVRNYLKAATRFRALGRLDISTYLERHAREENGHERLALRDLAALDLPAERLVSNLMPDGTATLCELFDRFSSAEYPVGCIGYSYFFESAAARRQKAEIDSLRSLCPSSSDATRFMRAHSSLGSEADHVTDMIAFISGLPAADRIAIVETTYATAAAVARAIDLYPPRTDADMWAEIHMAAAGQVIGVTV